MAKLKYLLLSLAFVISLACNPTAPSEPKQAELKYQSALIDLKQTYPGTERQFRSLTLPNQLKVLLISDPAAKKSSSAINVAVGSLSDPDESLGLAHFLEHMLFLGTKKYPEEGEYLRYLNSHKGYSNAFTADEDTNYHFEVSHESFAETLDRFSQFFIAPLFNPEFVKREMNAVNSEYQKNVQNPFWRFMQLKNLMVKKDHPSRRFSIGNLETLKNVDQKSLLDFYHKHYSANTMTLAMRSTKSLDEMQRLAEKYFSAIENRQLITPSYSSEIFDPKSLPMFISYKPIRDQKSLKLSFAVPSSYRYIESKAQTYLSQLIGYEGPGSLLSYLRNQNLATELAAGTSDATYGGTFTADITLTDKGAEEYERVIDLFFDYVHILKQTKLPPYIYEQAKVLAELDYAYRPVSDGVDDVVSFSGWLRHLEARDIDKKTTFYYRYSADDFLDYISQIIPQKMLAFLSTPTAATNQTEKFFNIEYSVKKATPRQISTWSKMQRHVDLYYPQPNQFLPKDLKLVTNDPAEQPYKLIDDERGTLWFMQDKKLKLPKATIQLRLYNQAVNGSPQKALLTDLYILSLNRKLIEWSYPISEAGITTQISKTAGAIEINLSGYADKMPLVLTEIIKQLKDINLSPETFDDIKAGYQQELDNFKYQKAIQQAIDHSDAIIYKHAIHRSALPSMKRITLKDVQNHALQMFSEISIEGVAYGNLDSSDLKNMITAIYSHLDALILPPEKRQKDDIIELEPGQNLAFVPQSSTDNNAWYKVFLLGPRNNQLFAPLLLGMTHLTPEFYNEMRTQRQLGYIVHSTVQPLRVAFGTLFGIQSGSYDPVYLADNANDWINQSLTSLRNITDEQLATYKESIISLLEQENQTLEDWLHYIDRVAFIENGNLAYRQEMIDAVKQTTRAQIVATYEKMFNPKTTQALSVYIAAKDTKRPVVKETPINNVMLFKQNLKVYAVPNNLVIQR